jgi:hypothetical protein
MWYAFDTVTGNSVSLKTRVRAEAVQKVNAMNEIERQPGISLGLARVYLNATDPKLATRICETRGSHRAVTGGLGKGLAGKSATQRATEVATGKFPTVVGFNRTNELRRGVC